MNLINWIRPFAQPLRRELHWNLLKHHVYALGVFTVLLTATAVPAYSVGGVSGLGLMLVIDGTLMGFSGHLVRLIPVVKGWKPANESQVNHSLENFREAMEILDEAEVLRTEQTGYDETARLLVDRYNVEIDPDDPATITIESDDEGPIELETGRTVCIDGEPIIDPNAPFEFQIPLAKLRADGEQYATHQRRTVEAEREHRQLHFDILGGLLLVLGTLLILLGTILTGFDFIQDLF